ncbi:hypothetical protein AA12717_0197 [Gluconacetobacter sacchari DSM 12717]|uniref:Uncharacterized protein n=1 Tax=Gluconacetobacter sacchari DSM 12717 TaxID=1307940 RepID=A0ABQ0P239_9PROT|nr:hypothetical protein [Gluconacetobacter sacchari]GBQ19291.1 hypothetical protein AA12717_0197 [Gluconacetobacter sacchari DSM 12717]
MLQIRVDDEPDFPGKIRAIAGQAFQGRVGIAEKAGQARDADARARRDVLAGDVADFADDGTGARDGQKPVLVRHIGILRVIGDEFPCRGLVAPGVVAAREERERHAAEPARDAAGLGGARQAHRDIGLAPAERNLLRLAGNGKLDVGMPPVKGENLPGEDIGREDRRRADGDLADERRSRGVNGSLYREGTGLHL